MSAMTLSALVASDLKINLLGGGLVILGLVLLVATIAFWRSTVEDPEVLAPLEVMAGRRFSRAGASRRDSMLNKVRPGAGAVDAALRESTTLVVEHAPSEVGEEEADPRVVRRLRGREPRRGRVHDDHSTGGFIDPLLDPRNTRE